MALRGGSDVRQLLLQVDASVALAQRNLGQLAAQVQRDSDRMDRSLGQVDGATTRLGGAFGRVTGIAASLGLALGVGTIANMGRDMLNFADDLQTAADQAGTSVERYQTLREALRALEIDTASTDRMFRQLQTTLGDVQAGAENSATAAIERLGLTSRILNGEITTSDQLLDALAEAATRAGTQAQYTSDIVDIFGQRIGPQLAAALRDGGDALHTLEQQMRETGTVIDSETIEKFAEANEVLDRFFESTKRQVVIWSADLISGLQDVAAAAQDFMNSLPHDFRFGQILNPLSTIAGIAARYATSEGRPEARNAGIIGSAIGQLNRPTARPPRTRGGGGGGGGGRSRRSGGGGRAARPRAAQRVAPTDFMSPWVEGPTLGEMDEEAARLAAMRSAVIDVSDLVQNIPTLDDLLSQEAADRMLDFARDFREDLAGGLAQAIIYGEDLGDALVDSLKRAAVALLESQLLSLMGGGAGTGGGGLIGSLLGSILGPGKAGGGPVFPGTVYPVGERGVELFAPKVPGVIIPNGAMGGGGGGPTTKIFDLRGAMVTSDLMNQINSMTDAKIVRSAPVLISAAKQEVMDSLGRRG